jgi:hypothetical protein
MDASHLGLLKITVDPKRVRVAVRHLIDRGDELGGLDRVAPLHQGQQ